MGMSYKSENYLCDINCVQLRKALARFQCGNMQLEVVLGAWKGVPYLENLRRGCDLGKVKDEEHLVLVCPNTQKVKECFCSALPLTHTSILARLMQTTNMVTLAKFVACCQYQRTMCPPWSTFHLMDSLVPNGRKIVNNKQYKIQKKLIKQQNSALDCWIVLWFAFNATMVAIIFWMPILGFALGIAFRTKILLTFLKINKNRSWLWHPMQIN
jgi:uncharacterized membrane protein YccF (DUF307 family)